jgi:dihydrofolate synthase / folylpolyglutamate synthase
MKLGLRNIRFLLRSVGNPESTFPSIHVAGTNGKGSTAAFLASIMMEAGRRTALYTSPHLVRFTERIRIDGRQISEKRLVAYVQALRPAIEKSGATFFEATTCIAFQYFADEHVDVAVIEAGLGGRLDSTNALTPIASVITNVGLDHTAILGKTVVSIAGEKAGIIKHGVPCITSSEDCRALKVLHKVADASGAPLYHARQLVKCDVDSGDPGLVSFRSQAFSVKNLKPGLAGPHQFLNARLAVATLQAMRTTRRHPQLAGQIKNPALRRGLENVVKNTGLRGRLETLDGSHRFIVDVAHNPDGVQMLVHALRAQGYAKLRVVFGVMKDKDYRKMVEILGPVSETIVAVAPAGKRALRVEALAKCVHKVGIPVISGGTVSRGIRRAQELFPRELILITGSHYVVGEALAILRRKKA